jgi:hypothetical protein
MNSLVIHTRSKSIDKKHVDDDTCRDKKIHDPEENQENDGTDYEEVDYYTAEGEYYYYLEVEEG